MDIGNPYQSPVQPASSPQPPSPAALGSAWRDGARMVLLGPTAPLVVCLMTGEPEIASCPTYVLVHQPVAATWGEFLLSLPQWLLAKVAPQYRTIQFPVGQSWLAGRFQRRVLAGCLLGGGILAALLGAMAVLPLVPLVGIVVTMTGTLCALAGGVLFGLGDGIHLTLTRLEGDFVWIDGAHPHYLEALPVWPGDQIMNPSQP